MTVTLREISGDNWEAVVDLKLPDDQQKFIRPNWYSMLQVNYIEIELYHRAIYADEQVVGYAMMGQDPDDKSGFIGRLMVAAEHQGKGYGRAAMQLIVDDLKARYNPTEIFIRVVPENIPALRLYQSLGFTDTGELSHGEMVLRMDLKA